MEKYRVIRKDGLEFRNYYNKGINVYKDGEEIYFYNPGDFSKNRGLTQEEFEKSVKNFNIDNIY